MILCGAWSCNSKLVCIDKKPNKIGNCKVYYLQNIWEISNLILFWKICSISGAAIKGFSLILRVKPLILIQITLLTLKSFHDGRTLPKLITLRHAIAYFLMWYFCIQILKFQFIIICFKYVLSLPHQVGLGVPYICEYMKEISHFSRLLVIVFIMNLRIFQEIKTNN